MTKALGRKFIYFFVVLIASLLVGCANNTTGKPAAINEKTEEKLRVVTTFAPLYSFTVNVAGDAALVENLVPVGTSIHTFQAKPSDIKKLAQADVLITNGVGLEEFLSDIIEAASNPNLLIIDTSKGINILDALEPEGDELGHEEEDEEHGHEEGDPHIWLSPKNAIRQVEAIRDALVKADSSNTKTYEKNAATYIEHLEQLDAEIAERLGKAEKKNYMVFHNAYQYFEEEYGMKSAAVIEKFPGKEPSPRYLKELIDLINNRDVRIVFTEPQFSPKLVNTLKQELGIYVGELDPIGSELSKDGYEKTMRDNLEAFLRAFAEDSNR